MNKKGISLVELLGAIVIFGLMTSLVALFLSVFLRASDRISINAKANQEGQLVVEILEDLMQDLSPTTYSTCGPNDCLVLEKEFAYEFDPIQEDVILVIYSPSQALQLEIDSNNVLKIDATAYVFNDFTLGALSSIVFTESSGILYVIIDLYLESADLEQFNFVATYSYSLESIPV